MSNKIIDNEVKNIIFRFKQTNNVNTSVKDLTHLKTYSIDDSQTFEIDDAISLEKIFISISYGSTLLPLLHILNINQLLIRRQGSLFQLFIYQLILIICFLKF